MTNEIKSVSHRTAKGICLLLFGILIEIASFAFSETLQFVCILVSIFLGLTLVLPGEAENREKSET